MTSSNATPRVLFLSGDLMFAARARNACQSAGGDFYFGSNLPQEDPDDQEVRLVILDLATRSTLTETLVPESRQRYPKATLVAYAPHVHKGRLQAAVAAGFDTVLTRGQFDGWLSRVDEWLS